MEQLTPAILTYAQLKRRYHGEWVVLIDYETDAELRVIRGRVLAHSPDRETAYAAIQASGVSNFATLSFVAPPEDSVILL